MLAVTVTVTVNDDQKFSTSELTVICGVVFQEDVLAQVIYLIQYFVSVTIYIYIYIYI